jgi:hypothetical protein
VKGREIDGDVMQQSSKPYTLALSRRSAHGDESVRRGIRRSVRAAAVRPPFPLGEVLPSTVSAEETPSLFDRFIGTTRSPTARGSSMQANTPWEMLPSLSPNEIGTSELDPFRSSILGPWSPL